MIIMARFITWALVSLIVIATVASLLEKPLMSVVAPVYAEDHYGSAASFGAMLGAFGALSAHWPSALWNTSSRAASPSWHACLLRPSSCPAHWPLRHNSRCCCLTVRSRRLDIEQSRHPA